MAAAEIDHTRGQVLARLVFPPDLQSLDGIRRFVEKWAAVVGLDGDQTFRMNLAVSEACANAIEHPTCRNDVTLWAWNHEDRFTIDVWHAGEFEARAGQDRSHRGLGLPLMVAAADEVRFAGLPEGGVRVSISVFFT